MEQESEGIVAPYGRSCEVCVKAKCKCLFRAGIDKCERCSRLNKDCKQPQVRRRRAAARRGDSNARPSDLARTARLEDKLDRVLESLKFARGPASSNSISDGRLPNNDASFGEPSINLQETATSRPGVNLTTPPSDTTHFTPSEHVPMAEAEARQFSATRAARAWRLANVFPAEAEERLREFRTGHIEWFPFIYIRPTTTSEQLRNERPFLWLNIMFLASHSATQHLTMGDVIRRELAEAMVVDSEKSLDLLLGLLVFMGWYHAHCQCVDGSVKLSLSLLTQLAISLVFDLQLNKREPKPPSVQTLGMATHKALRMPYPRTLEAKRAAVAVFLLSSLLAFYIQRIDPLRWTPYLNDNLRELEQTPEWPGDTILVQQVRMQAVVDRIHSISWFDAIFETSDNLRLPTVAYIQTLQAQLEQVKSNMPVDLQANSLLLLQHQINKININESHPPNIPNSSTSSAAANPSPISLTRTRLLTSSLAAAKSYFEAFFLIPPQTYPYLPFPLSTHIIHTLGLLFDLAILDEPGWDKTLVRTEVDSILTMMDRVAAGFEDAAPFLSVSSDGEGENAFRVYSRFIRQARVGVEARLAEGVVDGGLGLGGGVEGVGFDFEFLENPMFWNFATGMDGL